MISNNQLETIEYAKKIAKELKGGEIIGLIGDLGSGKTTFVKGFAEELKVEEGITSPTFVIMKNYQAKINDKKIELIHVDAYRMESLEDIKSVGIEDFFGRDDVVVIIEWAEKIKEILPKNTIYINFKYLDENKREIKTE